LAGDGLNPPEDGQDAARLGFGPIAFEDDLAAVQV